MAKKVCVLFLIFLSKSFAKDDAGNCQNLSGLKHPPNLISQQELVGPHQGQQREESQHQQHFVRQQQQQREEEVKEVMENWIAKMKNHAVENPIFETDLAGGLRHWISQCIDGSLHQGLAFDEKGRIEGRGELTFGENTFCSKTFQVSKVVGTFIDGLLVGEASIEFKNLTSFVATFRRGVLSGLARTFSCRYGHCDFEEVPDIDWNSPDWLTEVAFYKSGKRWGPAVEFKVGGGALMGKVDAEGDLTGDDVIYVYPDFKTLLVGEFRKSVMIAARLAFTRDVKFDDVTGIPVIVPGEIVNTDTDVYSFDEADKVVISKNPTLQDPYEKELVFVAPSKAPNAGRGAFSTRAQKKGTVVSFMNGVKMSFVESKLQRGKKYSHYTADNDWAVRNQVIDIPPNYRDLNDYNATLGHIVNHSDKPNALYGMFDHPRFGKIRSILLIKDVSAGDELFCNYGYLENYMQLTSVVDTFFAIGKLINNNDATKFRDNMKGGAKIIRKYVEDYKDELQMALSVLTSLTKFF